MPVVAVTLIQHDPWYVIAVALWFGPPCGRRWIAFLRDVHAYRDEHPRKRE
jgi:hypothetical protein